MQNPCINEYLHYVTNKPMHIDKIYFITNMLRCSTRIQAVYNKSHKTHN